jgi:hypothetical protein
MPRRAAAIAIAGIARNCSNSPGMGSPRGKSGSIARRLRAAVLCVAAYLQLYAPFLHEHEQGLAHAGWHVVRAAPDGSDQDPRDGNPHYPDTALARVATHAGAAPANAVDAPSRHASAVVRRDVEPPSNALGESSAPVHRALPPASRGPPALV